jgi:hypothetical protein
LKQEAELDQIECAWKRKADAYEQQVSLSLMVMKLWRLVVDSGGFVNACLSR